MTGIDAVHARIATLHDRFAQLAPSGRAGIGSVLGAEVYGPRVEGADSFDAALNAAAREAGVAGTGPVPGGPAPVAAALAGPVELVGGVPADLARYGNGKIPASALTPIGAGDHRLWAPAASAYQQMVVAAARDGISWGVTDSYRDYDSQVDVARRKGLYRDGGLAAVPGTSKHGWGLAVDLNLNPAAQQWMNANAERFGFVTIPREPWHWELDVSKLS